MRDVKQSRPFFAGMGALAAGELQRLYVTHVNDFAALALAATRDTTAVAEPRGVWEPQIFAQFCAIKSDISANLHTGKLAVAAIAVRHDVTPRCIHSLFESEGITYSHRMLSDPHLTNRTIAPSARWPTTGFGDLSYFRLLTACSKGGTMPLRRRRDIAAKIEPN